MIAQANGTEAKTEAVQGYPVLVNSAELVAEVRPLLEQVVGKGRLVDPGLITGAEDFAFYAQETPGVFFFLGVTSEGTDPATAASNHAPYFYADEAAFKTGVEALTTLALTSLSGK
ncbi:M20/M25/M40 family metallo-hydrolase [Shewanella chilikensis]|uniref:M20/M25/M40 family metallo-hydrolase n=1 Tax=Shewanella chilikensis TaxID=558541 RepID=UPI003003C6FE